jgi:cation:H+ antiporter
LVPFILIKVLAPGFYARQDTKTPVRIAVIAMVSNMVLNILLVFPLAHAGLALATALSAGLNAMLLFRGLRGEGVFQAEKGWGSLIVRGVVAALLMGVALFWGAFKPPRDTLRRDLPVALALPALTGALLFDGVLSRWDGAVLLLVFSSWLFVMVREMRRQRSAVEEVIGEPKLGPAVAESLAGVVLLVTAGRLILTAATGIAESHGVEPFIIGATIVAVGTTVPELATTIIARVKGHDEVGLGTILGSNIYNGGLIVGVVAVITPIDVDLTTVAPALILGMVAVALTIPGRSGALDWRRGVILLAVYGVYLAAVLQAG